MLDDCKTKEERWGGVNKLIDRWLQERQELIVLYCSLSGAYAFSPNSKNSMQKLSKFCQILVDYVSAGHFEVYDQLLKEAEAFDDTQDELVAEIYPKITMTTEIALDFNDKYDTDEHCDQAMDQLSKNLSKLGEILVSRFDLEDRLIEALHNSHADLVA